MIGDRLVNDVQPKDRDIAMVFQNYALYPHMTVFDNIGFALKLAKVPKREINERVRNVASLLELDQYLGSKPGQLSGGQRQRVAMGRAIVRRPQVFLMDEPLSNLDAKLRVQMRAEIARLQRNLGVTTVYVTHDQVEAMTMGDRVAVLKDGFLQQVDTPQNLYDRPTNVFVAGFMGSPSMNLYHATVIVDSDGGTVALGSQTIAFGPETMAKFPSLGNYAGQPVIVGVRPSDLEDAAIATDASAEQLIKGDVKLVEAHGSELVVHLRIDAKTVNSGDPDAATQEIGEGDANVVARFSRRADVHVGTPVEIAVNTDNLHFFDPETRDRIG
jgi:multiple sugar transport system ATP-binding protein